MVCEVGKGDTKALGRVMDANARALLEKVKRAGVEAVEEDGPEYCLLREMVGHLTREGWVGIKEEIEWMLLVEGHECVELYCVVWGRLYD